MTDAAERATAEGAEKGAEKRGIERSNAGLRAFHTGQYRSIHCSRIKIVHPH